ncbi:MAG: tetratricopeptide repeat protein [Planctomycetota bacterium]
MTTDTTVNTRSPRHCIRFSGMAVCLFFCVGLSAAEPDPAKPVIDVSDDASAKALIDAMKNDRFEYYEAALKFYSLRKDSEDNVSRDLAYDTLAETGAALLRLSRKLFSDAASVENETARAEMLKKAAQFESDGLIYLRGLAERSTGRRASGYWMRLADHFIATGDYGAADVMLKDAIKSDYLNHEAYALRGALRYRLKQYELSADDFETAIRLSVSAVPDPFYQPAALARQAAKQYPLAIDHYQRALKADPNNIALLSGRLFCANASGHTQSEAFRESLLARYMTPEAGQTAESFAQWQSKNAWMRVDAFEHQGHSITAYENLGATVLALYRPENNEPLFHFIYVVEATDDSPQRILSLESTGAAAEEGVPTSPKRRYYVSLYRASRRVPYGYVGGHLMKYDALRSLALDIFDGVRSPVSPTSPLAGVIGEETPDLPDFEPQSVTPDELLRVLRALNE